MLPSIYHYRWDWLPDPDLVQHVSLPLEIIGLFLALLEIYFPRHADRLEHAVDWLAESISELLPERPPKYSPEEEAELRSRSLTGSLPHAFDEWSNPALDPTMRQFGPGRYATKWEMFFESVALRMALACGMFAWYSLVGWFGVFIPFGLIILYHWLSATKSSAGEGGLFVTMILLGLPLLSRPSSVEDLGCIAYGVFLEEADDAVSVLL